MNTISIIVPTYNEEETIGTLLGNLWQLKPEEIIIADGNSADHTAEIAAQSARVVISARGRGIQMNAGAREASGEVLLFLHADVRLPPSGLEKIGESLRDPSIVGGDFDVRYQGGDWVAAIFTCVNRWRRRAGIFYGDSGIFCRRRVFEDLGGFRPWPVLEDYDFVRRLRKAGKLALLNEPIWVSDRRWRNEGVLSALWSWFWIQTLYFAGVHPERLAALYRNVRCPDRKGCGRVNANKKTTQHDDPSRGLP
ncbi:MAG: TIGR04283 family arsenosugar biosynthesis glycosyltransferase [Terriglobia bacterium]